MRTPCANRTRRTNFPRTSNGTVVFCPVAKVESTVNLPRRVGLRVPVRKHQQRVLLAVRPPRIRVVEVGRSIVQPQEAIPGRHTSEDERLTCQGYLLDDARLRGRMW